MSAGTQNPLAKTLADILADMVAPTLSAQERCSLLDNLVRGHEADAEELSACANALGGSGPEAYHHWIGLCVRELVQSHEETGLAKFVEDTPIARARLYSEWQGFLTRHKADLTGASGGNPPAGG